MACLAGALLVATAAGCTDYHACRPDTLRLSIDFADAAGADGVRVQITLDGGAAHELFDARAARAGVETVEIPFPSGYPAGQGATVLIEASLHGTVVARDTQHVELVAGCTPFAMKLVPPPQCVPTNQCPPDACGIKIDDGCGHTLTCTPCHLLAVHPSFAPPGARVTLEGTFGDGTNVTFAGGTTSAAMGMRQHRVTVEVPPGGVGVGELKAEGASDQTDLGTAPFRSVPFTLGLGTFRSNYEQVEGGRQMPWLSGPRVGGNVVAVGTSLVVLGGTTNFGVTPAAPIERATINVDGTLSAFSQPTGVALNRARRYATSTVVGTTIGNTIFVIGGEPSGSVERATVDDNGVLSSFTLQPSTLSTPRQQAGSVVLGNSLYMLGGGPVGNVSLPALATIERATIQPDGSLSSFAVDSVTLHTPRRSPLVVVRGDVLYVIGGDADGSGTVESATIGSDGSLSAFSVVDGVNFVQARHDFGGVLIGDTIYVVGGDGATPGLDSIESATFGAGDKLGKFSLTDGHLHTGRTAPLLQIVGNYAYVLGGIGHPATGWDPGLERASINTSGAASAFALDTQALPVSSRRGTSLVAAGRYLYAIGDGDGHTDVQRSTVGPDGSLQPFMNVPSVELQHIRGGACSAVIGNHVYVIGGAQPVDTSVEYATIADDGALSEFALLSGVTLKAGRQEHTCVVYRNFSGVSWLYVFGGDLDDTKTVESAEINYTDNALGDFKLVGELPHGMNIGNTTVLLDAEVYLGDYFYGDGPISDMQHATLNIGSFGPFSADADGQMKVHRYGAAGGVIGPTLLLVGGFSIPSNSSETATISGNRLVGFTLRPFETDLLFLSRMTMIGNWLYVIGDNTERADLQ